MNMEGNDGHASAPPVHPDEDDGNVGYHHQQTIPDIAPSHALSDVGTMEEQAMDDAKNPGQQESAYGSLESSSQGQSQKSSYSGSKSLNSGSSHSSGFGDHADYSENRIPNTEIKHKDHKKRKTKEKIEKPLPKEKTEKAKEEEKTEKDVPVAEEKGPRLIPEPPPNVIREAEEAPPEFPCHNNETEEPIFEQPTLVYTQALHYIRKIKERSVEQGIPLTSPELRKLPKDSSEFAAFLKSIKTTVGFTAAISIQDGTVLHVSPSITEVLGFPKDMLIGQSFIDFVYPRDSINLSSKIIHGMNPTFGAETIKDSSGTSFFCRMRMYHGLKSTGFGVRNKHTTYKPCKMTLKLHDPSDGEGSISGNRNILVASVVPIESAYKVPEEIPALSSFSTRHTGSCNFSEYDPEAIPYLGHLPQDLIGHSVFNCYHPLDLPLLRSVYERIVTNQGKLFKSNPYRFRTFNGSFVTLETEWLCFVNPWSKKIESIIGQHHVLKGPADIEIFLDPTDKPVTPLPEEVTKEAKKAQSDIIDLLDKPVAMYTDPSKEPQEVRRKSLAHAMTPIVEEMDHLEDKGIKSAKEKKVVPSVTRVSAQPPDKSQPPEAHPSVFPTNQDQVSVVMGEISPHQDDRYPEYNFSTSSPSSYSKLNYTETLQRFFRSQPKTASSDESGDSKMEVSRGDSTGGSGKHKQSQTNSQSQSCSGSGDNYCDNTRQSDSTGNGSGSGDTGRTSSLGRSYRHVQLTEEVLSKHNADMQKIFMQRQRTGGKAPKDKLKSTKKATKRTTERHHGVKRPSTAMEHESSAHKQAFIAPSAGETGQPLKPPPTDVWPRTDNTSSVPPCGANGPSVESNVGRASRLTAPSFPGIVPGFYLPTSSPNLSSIPSMDSMTIPQPPGPTIVMQHQQPTFLQPQANGVFFTSPGFSRCLPSSLPDYSSVAVPLQYMGAFPGVMYQPVGPPLFNAPPLMLPNVVYQHTVVQPPMGQVSMPQQSDGEKRSGAESEQEIETGKRLATKRPIVHLHRPDSQATSVKAEPGSARGSNASASGKLISTHSHAAESIRSYLEDTNQMSPGCAPKVSQLSQSTSVQAEAESIGSPGKQEKMIIGDQGPRVAGSRYSDMVMSASSSNYSSREYKSTDDSMQNISENSENSEASHSDARWNIPRSKCPRPILNDPQWLEDVKVTPELLYKYQLETKELVDVLRRDMDMLKRTKQPSLVDDQLSSLYNELELDGSNPDLHLEEGVTSSSGEEQAGPSAQENIPRKKKTSTYYSRIAMLHEEDAPMPPHDALNCREQLPAESSSYSS
ncbi:period circadian protein isoform X6 [Macrobrachium rosenbergii]|uniref:period circadian protein isoform X6 n=1 Tax=Macrobrachium rosenbergii TaxID=79674 RepID=UPI0034D471CB